MTTMTMERAIQIIGINAMYTPTANMAKALGMMNMLNTPEENERWAAAIYVTRRWKKYTAACAEVRKAQDEARWAKRAKFQII